MKNTKTPQSKDYKSEAIGREIIYKINKIGQKIYKLKKDVNGICGLVLSKPGATMFVEGYKAELWEEASDDFSQQWKEIAAEKYEVECMVHQMYDLILAEEIKRKGKIVLDTKGRAMSMAK